MLLVGSFEGITEIFTLLDFFGGVDKFDVSELFLKSEILFLFHGLSGGEAEFGNQIKFLFYSSSFSDTFN